MHHQAWRTSRLVFGGLDDGNLGSSEERGDTTGVNETSADDLEGIQDTGGDHVNVLALGGVETLVEVASVLVSQLANNDGALEASVLNDGTSRAGNGALDDTDTKLLVEVGGLEAVQSLGGGLEEGSTTTGQDTLLNGGAGSVQSIDEAILLLTNLDLGGTTDLDDGNTAGELGQTLLELLLLVLGGGRIGDDTADLLASLSNGVLATLTVEENGVLLGDGDGTSGTEQIRGSLLELDVELIGEDGTVGQDSEIAEDGLAVVTEAGGLDGSDLELTTELVENTDGKSLTVNVLSNDDKRASLLGRGLEGRDDVLDSGDLLLREENQRVLKLDLLGLGVGDEVGRDESTVESHTLSDLELILHSLALLDGDDTLLADLLHGIGYHLAEVVVAIGTDGSNLSDLLAGGDVTLVVLEKLDDSVDSSLDTTAQVHGVATGGNVLDSLGENGTAEDGGSGGTVTGNFVGLGGDVLEKTGTEVLELVLENDGLGNGDTVYNYS
ncbi:unnamed protein product [Clonostachys rhizophaga]|uniref:Uncharacterized protein n=1 Tax=Clonostachys rhizophaga TaxID=160324 RepID=A0A9N9YIY5_9HYPO|nr:unnamed protein product [Clonostachys rhizophaga]